ncbi:hypothetical protein Bca52824_083457 [Brassica carinata]|uniref:Rad60/SUMO-like domain-containing protein n=1 Tax=Brassica carinata TaxID=52824 RepID=A0A8X7TTV2_BRACI|nr:hypothetical protein Bca52824_083457 [Brassica carinata]
MGGEGEDLEPLFDYHRVQPSNFVCIDDDDDSDVSEVPVRKRSKTSHTVVKKDEEDVKVIEIACDDDWLPPPPKVVFDKSKESGEDSTIKALRSKKMELMSFTKTAVDVMQEAQESAKKEAQVSLKTSSEATPAQALPGPPINDRAKIVITIQDKDGQKQFRVFADEKFERVFKMYTDKEKLDPQNLVFTFDGDKIDPSTTPSNLEMEDGDMIELKLGSNCGLCSEAFSKVNARLPNLECQSIRSSLPEFVHQHGTWKGISAKDSGLVSVDLLSFVFRILLFHG